MDLDKNGLIKNKIICSTVSGFFQNSENSLLLTEILKISYLNLIFQIKN